MDRLHLTVWLCVVVSAAGSDVTSGVERLQDAFQELQDNGLRLQDIQTTINDADITMASIRGDVVIQQLSEELSASLGDAFTAISNIRDEAEALFSQSGDFDQQLPKLGSNDFAAADGRNFVQCCHAEESNMEFDLTFNLLIADDICLRRSESTGPDDGFVLSSGILDVIRRNKNSNRAIKWQYIGTELGTHVIHPYHSTTSCTHYDPRIRPWYVEAAAQEAKDIVLVIDTSDSMAGEKIALAKAAAVVVLETLNPNDRVAVVTFSSFVSTPLGNDNERCYSESLAYATHDVIEYFISHVNGLETAYTANKYIEAMEKAFQFFAGSAVDQDGDQRKRAILLLSDDAPVGSVTDSLIDAIRRENGRVRDEVLILTYGVGTTLSASAQEDLMRIAAATTSNPGHYTPIPDDSDLRHQFASYYSYFATSQTLDTPFITPSYIDFFGLGHITSICLPLFANNVTFVGATCVDVTIKDLTSGFTYFREGLNAYAFIIDDSGRTLVHPRLPEPGLQSDALPLMVNIDALEQDAARAGVIDRIKNGESGNQIVETLIPLSRGNDSLSGVVSRRVNATYHFRRIAGTTYSTCLVLTSDDESLELRVNEFDTSPVYHKTHVQQSVETCNHNERTSTQVSAFKLAPFAFMDPVLYEGALENRAFVDSIIAFVSGEIDSLPFDIQPGVREMVALTKQFEQFWQQSHFPWTHVHHVFFASVNGVIRMYPGAEVTKLYDPTLQAWYMAAIANYPALTVTAPHPSEFSGQTVVTISRALKATSSSAAFIGVVGMQVSVEFMRITLTAHLPQCQDGNFRCYLIDSTGFLLNTPAEHSETSPQRLSIGDVDSDVIQLMLDQGYLQQVTCNDFAWKKQHHTFYVTLPTPVDFMDSIQALYMAPIANTNAYVIVRDVSSIEGPVHECDVCRDKTHLQPCNSFSAPCYCPCYTNIQFHHCNNTFSRDARDVSTSPCSISLVDTQQVFNGSDMMASEANQPCFSHSCDVMADAWRCALAGCYWNDREDHCSEHVDDGESGNSSGSGSGADSTMIAVLVVAVVALLVIILVTVYVVKKKRHRHSSTTNDNDPYDTLDNQRRCTNLGFDADGNKPSERPTPCPHAGANDVETRYVQDIRERAPQQHKPSPAIVRSPPSAQLSSTMPREGHLTVDGRQPPPYSAAVTTPPVGCPGSGMNLSDDYISPAMTPQSHDVTAGGALASLNPSSSMTSLQPTAAGMTSLQPTAAGMTSLQPTAAGVMHLAEDLERSRLEEQMARKRREHIELELQMAQLGQTAAPHVNPDDISEIYLTNTFTK